MYAGIDIPEPVIKRTDMVDEMLDYAIEVSFEGMKLYELEVDIARYIKQKFDQRFGPVWMVIVGSNFGSFVTHQAQHFAYFYIGQKAILLFKGM